MASAIRQMTGVGGDVRKIARLLQKKAPPGHMLAYINQEEADLLKARGGSGEPHADTGVPSFEDYFYPAEPQPIQTNDNVEPLDLTSTQDSLYQTAGEQLNLADQYAQYRSAPSVAAQPVDMSAVRDTANPLFPEYQQYLRGQAGTSAAPAATDIAFSPRDVFATPRETGARESFDTSIIAPGGSEAPTVKVDKDLLGKISDLLPNLSDETKKRLGIGGVEAVLAAYQTNQAAEQARKAREDIQKVAQPYQEQGRKLIAQAQSGALTPAAQQTLQAAQAQAAQGAQARGGVGAQQAQTQVEALRQQLLQQQYDYGLKVLGIGDNIAVGAIRAGIDADRYVNQLTNSYANIARIVAGTPTVVSPYGSTSREG